MYFFLSMKLELSPSKKVQKRHFLTKKKELCKTLPKIPSYECQMLETHARITVIMWYSLNVMSWMGIQCQKNKNKMKPWNDEIKPFLPIFKESFSHSLNQVLPVFTAMWPKSF